MTTEPRATHFWRTSRRVSMSRLLADMFFRVYSNLEILDSSSAFKQIHCGCIVGQPEVIAVRRLLYDRRLPDCPSAMFSARTWAEPTTGHRWSIANGADMAVRTQTERTGSSLLCVYLQP